MRVLTTEQFNNAIAFLKNRHKVELSRATPDGEPRVTVDCQSLQRADVIRMAETEAGATAGSQLHRVEMATAAMAPIAVSRLFPRGVTWRLSG
jgi:hypothetical protein